MEVKLKVVIKLNKAQTERIRRGSGKNSEIMSKAQDFLWLICKI